MNMIQSVKNYVSNALDFNQATLSGAIDIVAVLDKEEYKCTPFHVRFGKLQILKSKEKRVSVYINGRLAKSLTMKLGAAGEAFFVQQSSDFVDEDYLTSPIGSPLLGSSSMSTLQGRNEPPFLRSSPSAATITAAAAASSSPPPPLSLVDHQEDKGFQPAEWNDTYRVILDDDCAEQGQKLEEKNQGGWWSWGWGSLPVVKTSEASKTQPVRNASIYFDALDTEQFAPFPFSDEEGGGYNIGLDLNDTAAATTSASVTTPPEADTSAAGRIQMSSCASELSESTSEDQARQIFATHLITMEQFYQNPLAIVHDPNLVVLIQGKMYPMSIAMGYFISLVVFQRAVPATYLDQLVQQHQHSKLSCANASAVSSSASCSPSKKEDLVGWLHPVRERANSSPERHRPRQCPPGEESSSAPIPIPSPPHTAPSTTTTTTTVPSPLEYELDEDVTSHCFQKSMRPTVEQLAQVWDLLHPGENRIEFKVYSSLQGERTVSASIYKLDPMTKLIVSDIDGTISKSDVLGHLMPMVGRDWTYEGVASLYTNLAKHGYQIVYLASRAIGQTGQTKEYLNNIVQDDNRTLPKGPVLLSPDRLIESYSRIKNQRTAEFKVAALTALRNLFPHDVNPFAAGFGNTDSDRVAYAQVGIPTGKIFIMNAEEDGKLYTAAMGRHHPLSYQSINQRIQLMFPPLDHTVSESDEAYNQVNFWRIPPGSIL